MWPKSFSPRVWILALSAAFLALPAIAQREGYSYVSYTGPDVALISDSEDENSVRANMPVLPGDRLETGSASRVEVILADGNILRIDGRSSLRLDRIAATYETSDTRNLFILDRGAISIENRSTPPSGNVTRIDTENATVLLPVRGLFRIDTGRRGTEVYVQSGRAEVLSRSGKTTLYAGDYAYVDEHDDIDADRWGFPRDRFTRFIEERRQRVPERRPEYVDADYGYDYYASDLDSYGNWVHVTGTGQYAWRPTVTADWSPYSQGYWRYTPGGLFWVSYEPWGWLPYHYGNWSFQAGFGWCWFPASYFSPAWVYWTYTPSWVGWCPIGYYNYRPHYYSRYRAWGYEGRSGHYAHLWGRVDVTRIDRHGWNFSSVHRMGARLERADIVRGDRVDFKGERIGVVATAPLRIERVSRGTVAASVQDAIRRVPMEGARGPATVESRGGHGGPGGGRPSSAINENLTALLSKDADLSAPVQEELKRSVVRTGQDPFYKPLAPEGLSSGIRRIDNTSASTRTGPSVSAPVPAGTGARSEPSSPSLSSPGASSPRRGETAAWREGSFETRPETNPRVESRNPSTGGTTDTSVSRPPERNPSVTAPDPGRSATREGRAGTTGSPASPGSTTTRETWREPGGARVEAPRTGSSSSPAQPAPQREGVSRPNTSPSSPSEKPSTREGSPAVPRTDEGWRSPSSSPQDTSRPREPRSNSTYVLPDGRSSGSTLPRSMETSSREAWRSQETITRPESSGRDVPSTSGVSRDNAVPRSGSWQSPSTESWRQNSSSGNSWGRTESGISRESSSSPSYSAPSSRGEVASPRREAPATRYEGPTSSPRGYDVPRAPAAQPRYQAPPAAPRSEAPRIEAPRIEAPRIEAPRAPVAAPRQEAPAVHAPAPRSESRPAPQNRGGQKDRPD